MYFTQNILVVCLKTKKQSLTIPLKPGPDQYHIHTHPPTTGNSDWRCQPNKKKSYIRARAQNLYLILRQRRHRIFFGRLQYSNIISGDGDSGGGRKYLALSLRLARSSLFFVSFANDKSR